MLPQIAFERLGLEMTATVDEIDARMREIAEDPKMKLTGEDRMKVFMMYEAAKWARRYIRDPSSCRSMSLEEHQNWSKMQSEKNQVEPTLEVKYQQLKLEVDEEVRRHSGVEAKQRNENTELKLKNQKLEAQLADKVAEIEKLKKSAEDERARSVKRLEEECQYRYKVEDHSKLRDSLFDVVSKDRYRLQCQERRIRTEFEELLGCVEEMKVILGVLEGNYPEDGKNACQEKQVCSSQLADQIEWAKLQGESGPQGDKQVPCHGIDIASSNKRKRVSEGEACARAINDFITNRVMEDAGDGFLPTSKVWDLFKTTLIVDVTFVQFSMEFSKQISSFFPNARRMRKESCKGYVGIKLR
jgi:hypothetical protein